MYLEFIYLILDYFKTISRRIFIYEWIVPFLISLTVFAFLLCGSSTASTTVFKDNSINLLGILVGFSITIITILTTGQGENIEAIKKKKIQVIIAGKKISLFRHLLINFTYSVVIEIILIIFCLIYPLFLDNIPFNNVVKYIGFSILVFSIIHLLLLTIRNLTDFYFILTISKPIVNKESVPPTEDPK